MLKDGQQGTDTFFDKDIRSNFWSLIHTVRSLKSSVTYRTSGLKKACLVIGYTPQELAERMAQSPAVKKFCTEKDLAEFTEACKKVEKWGGKIVLEAAKYEKP